MFKTIFDAVVDTLSAPDCAVWEVKLWKREKLFFKPSFKWKTSGSSVINLTPQARPQTSNQNLELHC